MNTDVTKPAVSIPEAVLPASLREAVATTIREWRDGGKMRRLWQRDASLWSGQDEAQWLGWLNIVEESRAALRGPLQLGEEVRQEGLTHILLLGMGGSSLGPEVLKRTFGVVAGAPELFVLDSTDPQQVLAFEKKIDLARTLFIVSSKSGSTLEPNIFLQYFLKRARDVLGDRAGGRFVAVTDPGSKLEAVAKAEGFRAIFAGVPSIGGRYSALSAFGIVPAAAMGLDVTRFLDRAAEMVTACSADTALEQNPGFQLGVLLGTAARLGRDKLTLVASPGIVSLGAWLEQLIAESTGKEGKGIIPVDLEPLSATSNYGADRLFVYLRLEGGIDPLQEQAVAQLEASGQPVIRMTLADTYALGQQFFCWEIATAVAGAVLGVHTFNQPDVEASKIATKKLTSEYEETGVLPSEKPFLIDGSIQLFSDAKNAAAITEAAELFSFESYLKAHLDRIRPGDYVALLAYVEMNDAHEVPLQAIRAQILERKKIASCLGFGPRFLHSTGQAYKGGPNTAVVLQVTCSDTSALPVPGQRYSFGVVKAAQARGDFQVLAERGRRALRVHLGTDVAAGLKRLEQAVAAALS